MLGRSSVTFFHYLANTLVRNIPFAGLAVLLMLTFLARPDRLAAQDDKNNVSVRFISPNYIYPLEEIPDALSPGMFFGSGIQFEYQRRLAPNFLLGVPLYVSNAEAIDRETPGLNLPFLEERDITQFGGIGTDLRLVVEPIARASFFDPQLFGGIGIFTESFRATNLSVPLGVILNFRLMENLYLSPSLAYRISLDDDEDKIRNNIQPGLGLHVPLGLAAPDPEPTPPPVTDADGDGTPDASDRCPRVAGPASLLGCPDTDGDGITDADDACPNEAGPASNNGCPVNDRDGDGVPDAEDACPDQPGTLALNGCPDTDGDGVTDASDRCPNEAGTPANNGCPDTDGDTVVDPDDRCPTEFGTVANKGCPDIEEEDVVILEDATQNINFETASANLTASSRTILDNVADIMRRYAAYSLAIGGHTDSIGSAESNQSLSERRARAVLDYLVSQGISAGRMTSQGFGETQPIADNRYAAGREENRRVTLDLSVR